MKNLINLILILSTVLLYSQQTLQARSVGGTISILNSREEVPDDTEGSPYIFSEYLNAKVDGGDNLFKIRYNGFSDEMEFVKDGTIYFIDTNIHKEVFFEGINKKYIFFDKNGYLLELFKGKNFTVYRKEKIEFKEKKKATTNFQQDIPAKYIRKKDIYHVQLPNSEIIELPKSKNKIIGLVEDKKSVNDYIKKNNLSISEENDILILFKYMDSLIL